jgi:hypothetical protein
VSHVLDHGAQASASSVTCGNAALSHQEKGIWQMSRGAESLDEASVART